MKKRIFCLLAALMLLLGLSMSASAYESAHVIDTEQLLSDEEGDALEARCQEMEDTFGCGVYIVTIDDYSLYYEAGSIEDFTESVFLDLGLGAGEDQGLGDVLDPALRPGVEEAHGVDLIPEELAADGLFHEGGEDIQDAAPDGELAHALHLLAAGIARRRQGLREGGEVQGLPGL